jgi:hypothetical protein
MDRSVSTLSLSTLKELDGRIEALVGEQIQRAARDCRERPELDKARIVKVQIELTPVFEDGVCADINVQIFVDDKHPPRRTRAYRLGVRNNNTLFFSPDNPEDITQPGLGFHGDDD